MKPTRALGTFLLASSMLASPITYAATITWDIGTADGAVITDGSGTWSDGAANWNNAGTDVNWTNATPDNAIFGGGTLGAVGTVTLGSAITAGSLTFNTPNGGGAYIINTDTFALTLNNGITANEDTTIQSGVGGSIILGGNNTWSVAATKTLAISSTISGIGFGVDKTGLGALTLSNTNTYTGQTTVSAGTLNASATDALGTGAALLVNGGTLDISTFNNTVGAVTLTGGNINGTSGILTGTSFALENGSISAILGGSGATLTKTTSGTVTLSGANTYTGATTINRGTLTLNRQTGTLAASALTFTGTSTFNMDNVGASGALTQTLGVLTFSAGEGTVKTTRTANFDQAVTFASLAARAAGATGNFVNTGTNSATNGFIFTSAPTAGTLIDRGIFYNGSSYATYDAGGFVRAYGSSDTNYLAAPTNPTIGASTASSNVDLTTGNITAQTTASANTINMRNFNIAMTGTSAVLSTNGILSSGSSTATLGGGTTPVLQTATSGGELVIRVDGSSDVLTVSSAIATNGGSRLTKSGAGTLILTNTNTFSGSTTVSAGTLTLTNALALQNSALDTNSAGTVTLSGPTTLTLGGLTGAVALGTGNIFATGYSGVTALTLNPLSGSLTYSGAINNGSGTMTLTKTGAGTQILTGANTYTGTTTISGGTLTIGNGTTGSLGTTPSTFLGALTFNNSGGTFNVAEATGSNQKMGALTFTAGDGNVTSTAAGGAGNLATLTFDSLAVRAPGATGNFTLAANTTVGENKILLTTTTNAPLTSGSNNRGLFFGGTEYARYDATNGFKATAYGTDTNAPALVSGTTIGATTIATDIKLNGAISAQTATTVNTINLGGANNITFNNTAQTLSVNGILASANATLINGTNASTIRPGTAGGELVIRVDGSSNTLGIQPIIANFTSASALTKSGAGTLNIVNNNTYTGATTINGGTLQIGGAGTLAGSYAGAIAISQGATLNWVSSASQTLAGNITGQGSVILNNSAAVLTLSGASNTFSGGFTLTSGAINIPAGTYTGFGSGVVTLSGGTLSAPSNSPTINIGNDMVWTAPITLTRASSGTPNWTFNGNITLGGNSGYANGNTTLSNTVIFNGNISESVVGSTLTATVGSVAGNNFTFNGQNTFTGAITQVTNGTVVVGGSGYLGGGSFAANITAPGSFTYSSSANQLLSGIINTAVLTKSTSTASTLTLSGASANVISGLTTVSAGTLALDKSGAVNAIVNGGLTIGGNNNTAATVQYTGASSNMMGTGAVTINGRGILDFNGKTDTIGNVTIVSTGATGSNPTPIINTAGGGNLTIGSTGTVLTITPAAGFTSVVNAGTGTITLGGNVTFTAATTGQAQISGTALALGAANRIFAVGLGSGATQDLLVDAQITGARSLTKTGFGRLTLANTNAHTLGTTVSAGTLLLSGAFNMPSAGTLLVSNGGTFSLADGTARATTGATTGVGLNLATGSTMAFDWNGGSLDSFTTAGTATATGTVLININNTSPTGSGGTLISAAAGSTLSSASYLLANNTNYTATISSTATTVSIGAQTSVAVLTDAYWKGGQVTGALGTMSASTGALSNWATDAAGTATALVPGSTTNAIFSASGATQQATVITGTDMNVNSITFNDDVVGGVTIAGSSSTITLNSTSSTAATSSGSGTAVTAGSAISVTSSAAAANIISANLALAANQTWNIANGKTLTVSGIVSGAGSSLTKSDAGTLVLSNTSNGSSYSGGTNLAAGTLSFANSALGTAGNITFTGNSTLQWATGNTQDISSRLVMTNGVTSTFDTQANNVTLASAIGNSTTGSLTKVGSGNLTLSAVPTYTGTTTISAGNLTFAGNLTTGSISDSSAITLNQGAQLTIAAATSLGALSAGNTLSAPITLAGGAGTATIRFGRGDTKYTLSDGITGQASVTQTLAIISGLTGTGNNERQNIIFSGPIANGGSGGVLNLTVDYTSASSTVQDEYVNLAGQNSFTGPITVSNTKGFVYNNLQTTSAQGAYLVIGGEIGHVGFGARTVTSGTGGIGWNGSSYDYTNTIALATGTVLDYISNSDQILGGVISGGGNIVKEAGTGILTLSAANSYSGVTNIAAGTLKLGAAGNGTNSALGTIAAGTTVSGTGTLDLNGISLSTAEALTLSGTGTSSSGALANSGVAATYSGLVTLGAAASIVSNNNIILSNVGTITGATFGLTLSGTATGSSISSIIGTTTGTLTKSGTGTWTLSGANTYTGITTVNGGNLTLAFGGVASNIISASSALTLGGGTLQMTGTGTQTLNGLTTTASTGSRILLGASETLTLGALTSAGASSALNFNTAAGGANATTPAIGTGIVVLTGQTAGNVINSGFTVTDAGGFGLATVNGSNQVVRRTTTTLLPASLSGSTTDYQVDNNVGGPGAAGSSSLIVTASQTTKSITTDTTTASGALTINSTFLLSNNTWNFGGTGSNTYQVANAVGAAAGTGIRSAATANTITFNNYNVGTVTIASPIISFGTNAVIVKGTGATVFSGANTYTGVTTVNGGTLVITNTNTTTSVSIAAGSLQLGDGTTNTGAFASATSVSIAAGATLAYNRTGTAGQGASSALGNSAVISGAGSLLMMGGGGTGGLTLNQANTFTGGVTSQAGTIRIGSVGSSTTGPLGNGGTFTINGGSIDAVGSDRVVVNVNPIAVGGDFGFTGSFNLTLPGTVNLGGATRTITTTANTLTLTGAVSNGSLTKAGDGTLVLNGTNTYQGGTTVSAGTLSLAHASAAGSGGIAVTGSSATLEIASGITIGNAITLSNSGASVLRHVADAGTYNVGNNMKSSFDGGKPDTLAAILEGINSNTSGATLTMKFSDTSTASNDGIRRSDVFSLSGVTTGDVFVLQLSTPNTTDAPDSVLGWNNAGIWVNAVEGNIGAGSEAGHYLKSFSAFLADYSNTFNAATMLGAFGYHFDSGTGTRTTWAVLNHNSEFSMIPEPTTALAGLLLAAGLLRRRR